MGPSLTIETGAGVRRVVVHFDRGQQAAGITLLQRILPALQELDRLSREPADQARARG